MKLIHVLAALPFLGMLDGIFFANRTQPFVLGIAFILFSVVLWGMLTSVIMAAVYYLDRPTNNVVTKRAAAEGILVSSTIVTYQTVFEIQLRAVFPFMGFVGDTNVGIVALLANIVVLVAVSSATRPLTVTEEAGQRA